MAGGLELVLTDEANLLPLTHALRQGWATAPCPVRWLAPAAAERAPAGRTLALVSPLAYRRVAPTHAVVAGVAVAASIRGAAALAGARRPDELVGVEIDARDVTETTEALTHILAARHFGAQGWLVTRAPRPGAPARLLEGDAALVALAGQAGAGGREPGAGDVAGGDRGLGTDAVGRDRPGSIGDRRLAADDWSGGHVEDLGRAWFVSTGLPWVSHVLLVARATATERPDDVAAIVAALRESLRLGREHAATVVAEAAARLGAPTGPLRALFDARTYQLGVEESKALERFFLLAGRHAGLAPVPEIAVL